LKPCVLVSNCPFSELLKKTFDGCKRHDSDDE